MKKRWTRWFAASMVVVLMIGTIHVTNVSAKGFSSQNYLRNQSDMVEELLSQNMEEDTEASREVKAILYNCSDYGLRSEVNGLEELVTMYSGQQMVITSHVIAPDNSEWYGVKVSVSDTQYTGYIEAEYVLSNATQNLESIEMMNMSEVPAVQSAEGTQEEVLSDVDTVAQLTADDFEASIAAFPESYKDSLRALHRTHPNWVFVPQITNIDWNTFIEAEMSPERSLVPRSMHDSYKGKQSWAYNPETGEYYGLSGYGWVQASEEAVEYYADPRNFLNEQEVFQFELLTYNSAYQTEAGVEAIIRGTFMANTQMPDDVVTYGKAFCLAGNQTNVSPYMLAARVRQEQGTSGTSPLISGTYPGYVGLYNFFNIGAYGTTETDIYVNGLTRAREGGWTTRYNSIAGGASVLGGNYISKGQDTLYLQKFDVDDSYYGVFSHQYMQNILGACNEGKTAYKAYSDIGILDNSFVFKIPIYTNMPIAASPKPDGVQYDEAAIKAFITRLYQNILGREPDESGMAHWYRCLTTGNESAATVTTRFVFSTEFVNMNLSDEAFVECMYRTMLGRASDPSGKTHWLDILDSGCSRRYVLSRFIASTEFSGICATYGVKPGSVELTEARDQYIGATKFVTRLYRTALKRNPDVDGLNHWVGLIGTKKTTPYDVAERIVKSQEFQNHNYSNEEYVTILYNSFLDREPDPSGYEHWLKRLATGSTREDILRGFAYSKEFKELAAKYGL